MFWVATFKEMSLTDDSVHAEFSFWPALNWEITLPGRSANCIKDTSALFCVLCKCQQSYLTSAIHIYHGVKKKKKRIPCRCGGRKFISSEWSGMGEVSIDHARRRCQLHSICFYFFLRLELCDSFLASLFFFSLSPLPSVSFLQPPQFVVFFLFFFSSILVASPECVVSNQAVCGCQSHINFHP